MYLYVCRFFSLQYLFLRTFRYNNEYISVSEGDMAANKKKKLGKAKPVADFSHPLLVTREKLQALTLALPANISLAQLQVVYLLH